jgi:hypothetical protein
MLPKESLASSVAQPTAGTPSGSTLKTLQMLSWSVKCFLCLTTGQSICRVKRSSGNRKKPVNRFDVMVTYDDGAS